MLLPSHAQLYLCAGLEGATGRGEGGHEGKKVRKGGKDRDTKRGDGEMLVGFKRRNKCEGIPGAKLQRNRE